MRGPRIWGKWSGGEKEKMMYSWSLNTRVLTAQIDLYTIHFLIVNTTVLNDFTFIFFFFLFHHSTTQSIAGWIWRCRTKLWIADYKLNPDFWVHEGSVLLTPHIVQGLTVLEFTCNIVFSAISLLCLCSLFPFLYCILLDCVSLYSCSNFPSCIWNLCTLFYYFIGYP